MNYKPLLLCSALFLAACGGSTNYATTPLSSLGFANGAQIADMTNVSFVVPNQQMSVRSGTGAPAFDRQTIEVIVAGDPEKPTFMIDGISCELTENAPDSGE